MSEPRNQFWHAEPQIPRLAHFVWLGCPMPPTIARNVARFRELHPGWIVNVVSDVPADMPEDLKRGCDKVDQLCQRADLIRLWLLKTHGGFYIDADVLAVRSFEPLRNYDHVLFRNPLEASGRITNSVMGAVQNHYAVCEALRRCSEIIAAGRPLRRCSFGPDLLAGVGKAMAGRLNLQPMHWIQPYESPNSALNFARLPVEKQQGELEKISAKFTDGVWPFCVHHRGVPHQEMPAGDGRSSFTRPIGRGDAILKRLPSGVVRVAEVGVLAGRLSAYLLAHRQDLILTMVDPWKEFAADSRYRKSRDTAANQTQAQCEVTMATALKATEFAAGRRTVIRDLSVFAARSIANESLDGAFLDADHSYDAVKEDLREWWQKVKPGGWIGGHDIDNRCPPWGVRQAVEEFCAANKLTLETDRDFTWFARKSIVPAPKVEVTEREGCPVAATARTVLVGNGPGVLGRNLGATIDGFDEVLRFNKYHLDGFTKDVGSKTTLWVTFGRGTLPETSEPPKRILFIHGNNGLPARGGDVWRVPLAFYNTLRAKIQKLSKREGEKLAKVAPSSGCLAACWLLECGVKQVHIIGFDHFAKEKSHLHHYWVNRSFGKPAEHDGDAEAILMGELRNAGRIVYI